MWIFRLGLILIPFFKKYSLTNQKVGRGNKFEDSRSAAEPSNAGTAGAFVKRIYPHLDLSLTLDPLLFRDLREERWPSAIRIYFLSRIIPSLATFSFCTFHPLWHNSSHDDGSSKKTILCELYEKLYTSTYEIKFVCSSLFLEECGWKNFYFLLPKDAECSWHFSSQSGFAAKFNICALRWITFYS